MKAAYIEKPCPAENILYGDLPLPILQPGEALVRMEAVAVNHVDTFIRSGAYATDLPSPFIIGRDMVGTVNNPGTTYLKTGQRVWTNSMGFDGRQGTFAEYVAVPESQLYLLPQSVEPITAVATLHAALTAIIGLFTKAQLRAGDSLFIHGGSGNIGIAVLQLAKASGARVAVTAGNDEKADWCRQNGADLVIDYHREDIPTKLQEFAPAGLDVFWEATSAFDMEKILPSMANHSRIILMAGHDAHCTLPVWHFYTNNCSLLGFTVTGTSIDQLQTYAEQINSWLGKGILHAKTHDVLPLSHAAKAHQLEESGKHFGKIVLVPETT